MHAPVPDTYHPRWGTVEDRAVLERAVAEQVGVLANLLGSSPRDIVDVCKGPRGKSFPMSLCERDLRLYRFALLTVLQTL